MSSPAGRKKKNRRSILEDFGGGRAPGQADQVSAKDVVAAAAAPPAALDAVGEGDGVESGGGEESAPLPPAWEPTPCVPGEARLIVIQITDVYTLENLASVKTMIADIRARANEGTEVISVMTGDFLAPYLLSSVDRGNGMMNALAKIPIDYITWGNHEADINHKVVCRHVREFPGKWINSNMLDHEAMDAQEEFDVVRIKSADGTNARKVGLVAVLSDDPNLYAQFKEPGAFGGATIDDPWETLAKYKDLLEGPDHGVDVVLPLQHLYVPDDLKTCRRFDFPVILSGHDHHRVDQVVEGSRLLKCGMDAIYATVLELSWPDENSAKRPVVDAQFVRTSDWEPEPELQEENERAYDVLAPLRNTQLASVPSSFEPLSSVGARGSVTTMGKFVCTLLRSSLNSSRRQRRHLVDAVLLMGGNIRAGTDYPPGSFFSLEALRAEIKSDEVTAVVPMPGWLLSRGVGETHAGDPIPGWMQHDDGVVEDASVTPSIVTHVGGMPIEDDRVYRVATKISDLTNGQCPAWTKYYKDHPEVLPPKGAYANTHAELMQYFAKSLWRRIFLSISQNLEDKKHPMLGRRSRKSVASSVIDAMDSDRDGTISVEEVQHALADIADLSVDRRELTLAKFIHGYANISGTGDITLEDLRAFYNDMTEEDPYGRDKWLSGMTKTHRKTAPAELVAKMAEEGKRA